MIATFACIVICIIWIVFILGIFGQYDKPPQKLSFKKILLVGLLGVSVPFFVIWLRLNYPGILFWIGLIFLLLAFISFMGFGMRR